MRGHQPEAGHLKSKLQCDSEVLSVSEAPPLFSLERVKKSPVVALPGSESISSVFS